MVWKAAVRCFASSSESDLPVPAATRRRGPSPEPVEEKHFYLWFYWLAVQISSDQVSELWRASTREPSLWRRGFSE